MLIGIPGSGKSTFASRHFSPTEIVSTQFTRALITDDASNPGPDSDVSEVMKLLVEKRLARRRLSVVDATNVRKDHRQYFLDLAHIYHVPVVAIVFDLNEELCIQRPRAKNSQDRGANVFRREAELLRQSLRGLTDEGYSNVYTFSSPEEVDAASVKRVPLSVDRRGDHGPFDVIGDVHGCFDELVTLLNVLGYRREERGGKDAYAHPEGRRVIFVGDLVDRGPGVVTAFELMMDMVDAGTALCVEGNHDEKFIRKLNGRDVKVKEGLAKTLAQIEALPSVERNSFIERVRAFADCMSSHYWLDDGKLVVAHAGLGEAMHGRDSSAVQEFALYGARSNDKNAKDEFGRAVRYDWAANYRGGAFVVYGHMAVLRAEWRNRTICIDTGCVYGGELTALRYPEREIVSVPAKKRYWDDGRPLQEIGETLLAPPDSMPDELSGDAKRLFSHRR
jgi:protein phosphatase